MRFCACLLAIGTAAAVVLGPSGTAVSGARPVPVRTCAQADYLPDGGATPTPPGTYVLNRVFFGGDADASWYQGARLGSSRVGPRTRFAKVGLLVETGAPITLRVPAASRRAFSLGWTGKRGAPEIRVQGCPPDSNGPWTFYAGGLLFHHPVCAPVQVRVDGVWATVRFGLGRWCPRTAAAKAQADVSVS